MSGHTKARRAGAEAGASAPSLKSTRQSAHGAGATGLRGDPAGRCGRAVSATPDPAGARPGPAGTGGITLAAWPVCERPREKLRAGGFPALSDTDLLALLLGTGSRRCSVMELSRRLVERFGSVRGVLHARDEELGGLHGLGAAKRARLRVIGELCRRALTEEMRAATQFDGPRSVRDFLVLRLGGATREIFFCLYLSVRHQLIEAEESSVGTLSHTAVYPREIARRALALNAAGVVVAHNHPSGVAAPSEADRQLTARLREVLAMLDVTLLDHLVIAGNRAYSFREHGML